MTRLAANLTMLFTEAPDLERPRHARASGFDGVEVLFPYDHPAEAWRAALAGFPVALINTPPGDWAAGDRGWAAVPGETTRFREGFLQALDYARLLGATHIHVMCGNATGPAAEATLAENLRWATAQAPGQSLTLEPLNPIDMPGYFLGGFDQAAELIRKSACRRSGFRSTCGTSAAWALIQPVSGRATAQLRDMSRSPACANGLSRTPRQQHG